MIAQVVRIERDTHAVSDPFVAEQAWRDGDVIGAIEAADRALAADTDTDGRAAGVAAAGAAADGALLDAAARWRGVGSALDGAAAARAAGRAALAAALAGDVAAAVDDLASARTSCRTRHPAGSPCCSAARVWWSRPWRAPSSAPRGTSPDSPPPASRRTRWPRNGWTSWPSP